MIIKCRLLLATTRVYGCQEIARLRLRRWYDAYMNTASVEKFHLEATVCWNS